MSKYKTRSQQLEEQVCYLRWQLYQKERLIQQAVEHDKYLQKKDSNEIKNYKPLLDRTRLKIKVNQEEYTEPLLLTRHDTNSLKQSEELYKSKLTNAYQVHIDSINRLKSELESMRCNTKEGKLLYEYKSKKLFELEEKLCGIIDKSLQPSPRLRVTSPSHWK